MTEMGGQRDLLRFESIRAFNFGFYIPGTSYNLRYSVEILNRLKQRGGFNGYFNLKTFLFGLEWLYLYEGLLNVLSILTLT